jgi:hypothetical protein
MGREWFTPKKITGKLREIEVLLGQDTKIGHPIRRSPCQIPLSPKAIRETPSSAVTRM